MSVTECAKTEQFSVYSKIGFIAYLTLCDVYGGNNNEEACDNLNNHQPRWLAGNCPCDLRLTLKNDCATPRIAFPFSISCRSCSSHCLFVFWWKLLKCRTAESRILLKKMSPQSPRHMEGQCGSSLEWSNHTENLLLVYKSSIAASQELPPYADQRTDL